jgi:nucleoside-diphosphate-sugar epimerase
MFAPIGEGQVLLTGGTGFVGRAVMRELREQGCDSVAAPSSVDFDLTGHLANRGEAEARSASSGDPSRA